MNRCDSGKTTETDNDDDGGKDDHEDEKKQQKKLNNDDDKKGTLETKWKHAHIVHRISNKFSESVEDV